MQQKKKLAYQRPIVIRLGTVTEHTARGPGILLDMTLFRRGLV
jgi:hypothetical protein